MCKEVRRGFVEKDKIEFSIENHAILIDASIDISYLLNRKYKIKGAVTFVGNHYLLSERQRMFLSRSLSPGYDLKLRKDKKISIDKLYDKTVHIDGFNTIITLEVALSKGLLMRCQDETIRDLAGLRGTYRIIDKTQLAINHILETLSEKGVSLVEFYLDAPVSNSGRLRSLIMEMSSFYPMEINVNVIENVDTILEKLDHVITSDAIILNKCISWINLNDYILKNKIENSWLLDIVSNTKE